MSNIKLFYRASYNNTKHTDTKVRNWLKDNHIHYKETPIEEVTYTELLHLLSLSEGGFEDLICKRGKYYREICERRLLDHSMSFTAFVQVVLEHPQLLRTPIVFDEKRLQIGFHSDEIRKFIPRQVRKLELQ